MSAASCSRFSIQPAGPSWPNREVNHRCEEWYTEELALLARRNRVPNRMKIGEELSLIWAYSAESKSRFKLRRRHADQRIERFHRRILS